MRTKKETTTPTEGPVQRDPRTGQFVTAQPNPGFYQTPSYLYQGPPESFNVNMFISQILGMKSNLEMAIFYHKMDIKTCKKHIRDDKKQFGIYVTNIANELFDVRAWLTSGTDVTVFVDMLEKELPDLESLLEKINNMLDEITSDPEPIVDDKPNADAPGMLGDTPIDGFGWVRVSKE